MISRQAGIDEDLYGGYNDYPSIYNTEDLGEDSVFQEAVQMSNYRKNIITPKVPGTAMRLGTSSGFHRTGAGLISRPPTGPRPMTAVRGAGYTSSRQVIFDPLNMGNTSRGPAPPLESRKEDTPEEKIKSAERKIMDLI
ncbi:intraflagellar transport protein 88 homolog, partial [Diachasma alloeum]|uniref:intraflagellar transport protein 88 homolog n=1 Tax=Diachasma alloeum TaxID=454923 RepID=UPI000738236E